MAAFGGGSATAGAVVGGRKASPVASIGQASPQGPSAAAGLEVLGCPAAFGLSLGHPPDPPPPPTSLPVCAVVFCVRFFCVATPAPCHPPLPSSPPPPYLPRAIGSAISLAACTVLPWPLGGGCLKRAAAAAGCVARAVGGVPAAATAGAAGAAGAATRARGGARAVVVTGAAASATGTVKAGPGQGSAPPFMAIAKEDEASSCTMVARTLAAGGGARGGDRTRGGGGWGRDAGGRGGRRPRPVRQ